MSGYKLPSSRLVKITIATACTLASALAIYAAVRPGVLVIENRLGPAQCAATFDNGGVWRFSIGNAEKLERLMLLGLPHEVTWACSSEGVDYSGHEPSCTIWRGPIDLVLLDTPPGEDGPFC